MDDTFVYKVGKDKKLDYVTAEINSAIRRMKRAGYQKVDARVSPGNYREFDITNNYCFKEIENFLIQQCFFEGEFSNANIVIQPIKNGKKSIFEEVNYFPY